MPVTLIKKNATVAGQLDEASAAEVAAAVLAAMVGRPGSSVCGKLALNGSGVVALVPAAPVAPATGYIVAAFGYGDGSLSAAAGKIYYTDATHQIQSVAGAADSGLQVGYIVTYY